MIQAGEHKDHSSRIRATGTRYRPGVHWNHMAECRLGHNIGCADDTGDYWKHTGAGYRLDGHGECYRSQRLHWEALGNT